MRAAADPEALAPLARWIAAALREGQGPTALAANDEEKDPPPSPKKRRRRADPEPIRCVVAACAAPRNCV